MISKYYLNTIITNITIAILTMTMTNEKEIEVAITKM